MQLHALACIRQRMNAYMSVWLIGAFAIWFRFGYLLWSVKKWAAHKSFAFHFYCKCTLTFDVWESILFSVLSFSVCVSCFISGFKLIAQNYKNTFYQLASLISILFLSQLRSYSPPKLDAWMCLCVNMTKKNRYLASRCLPTVLFVDLINNLTYCNHRWFSPLWLLHIKCEWPDSMLCYCYCCCFCCFALIFFCHSFFYEWIDSIN